MIYTKFTKKVILITAALFILSFIGCDFLDMDSAKNSSVTSLELGVGYEGYISTGEIRYFKIELGDYIYAYDTNTHNNYRINIYENDYYVNGYYPYTSSFYSDSLKGSRYYDDTEYSSSYNRTDTLDFYQTSGMYYDDFTVNEYQNKNIVIFSIKADTGGSFAIVAVRESLLTGVAGGYIFYDKGYYSDGWRYLEAAPESTEWNKVWGNYGIEISGADGIEVGKGMQNTVNIVNQLGNGDYAAKLCYDLVYNGYDDWFLPSKDELNLMYTNLYQKNVGKFADSSYWSSSECSSYNAWNQDFYQGTQHDGDKSYGIQVRAVRAF